MQRLNAATRIEVQALRKIVSQNAGYNLRRAYLVNPDFCENVIERLGLQEYKHTNIIEVNPGLGLWSAVLQNHLKPKRHILLEPDLRFEPIMKDLKQKYPGIDYIPLSGYRWSTYNKMFSKKPPPPFPKGFQFRPKTVPPEEGVNTDLLFTGNLTAIADHKLIAQFIICCAKQRWVQQFGRVRLLLWTPDDVKDSYIPKTISARLRPAVLAETLCDVFEVAGAPLKRTGQGYYKAYSDDTNEELSEETVCGGDTLGALHGTAMKQNPHSDAAALQVEEVEEENYRWMQEQADVERAQLVPPTEVPTPSESGSEAVRKPRRSSLKAKKAALELKKEAQELKKEARKLKKKAQKLKTEGLKLEEAQKLEEEAQKLEEEAPKLEEEAQKLKTGAQKLKEESPKLEEARKKKQAKLEEARIKKEAKLEEARIKKQAKLAEQQERACLQEKEAPAREREKDAKALEAEELVGREEKSGGSEEQSPSDPLLYHLRFPSWYMPKKGRRKDNSEIYGDVVQKGLQRLEGKGAITGERLNSNREYNEYLKYWERPSLASLKDKAMEDDAYTKNVDHELLMWNKRPYDPLLLDEEVDVYPHLPVCLLSITPTLLDPFFRVEDAAKRELRFDTYDFFIRLLFTLRAKSIETALKSLSPGAEELLEEEGVKGFIEPDMRVRLLRKEQFVALAKAWEKWPFKFQGAPWDRWKQRSPLQLFYGF